MKRGQWELIADTLRKQAHIVPEKLMIELNCDFCSILYSNNNEFDWTHFILDIYTPGGYKRN